MSRQRGSGVELLLTTCPQCGAPAEVDQVRDLDSTAGPVPHARVYCARRHWFCMPVDGLPGMPDPRDGRAPLEHR